MKATSIHKIVFVTCGLLTGGNFSKGQTANDMDIELTVKPGQGLTLEEAMDASERHDFGVRISQASVREAQSRSSQTLGMMGPKVSVEGNKIWFDKSVNDLTGQTLPNGTLIPEKLTNAAVVISQPLVGLGPLWLKSKADVLNGEIAATDEAGASLDARLRGAEAFIRALKAQRFLQIAATSLGVIDKQRQDALSLRKQGRLAESDILRFDFASSDAKTQLMQAKSAVSIAAYSLIEVLGLSPTTKQIQLQAVGANGWKSQDTALPPIERLLAAAETRRPDLQAAGKRAEAASYAKRASDYDYAPSLNAFARYQRDFEATDLTVPFPGQPTKYDKEDIRDNFSYGLTATWTIWDWGTRRSRSAEFAATIDKAKAVEEAAKSRAHLEIVQAYMELRYATEALESSRVSARLGQEVYRTTSLKFANGIATTTDMLTAERDQARAQLALANAEGDADFAWLKLRKVSGASPSLNKAFE